MAAVRRAWPSATSVAIAIAVALGVALRVRAFVAFRSLWMDEAMLAVNIVERPLAALAEPLEYNQGAPLGFLVLQKLAVVALGDHDWALRLVPLVASIVALALFARVAARSLAGAAPVVVAAAAISVPLVDYSTEAKQYSLDVLVATALLGCAAALIEGRRGATARAVVAGAMAPWFSHPAAFFLPALGAIVAWRRGAGEAGRRWIEIAGIAALWSASAFALYRASLATLASNAALLDYWRAYFMPLAAGSALPWLGSALRGLFEQAAGLVPSTGAIALAGLGLVGFAWRRPALLAATAGPVAVCLGASAAGLYPFAQRLLLFAVPGVLILMGEGLRVLAAASTRLHARAAVALTTILAAALLAAPTQAAYARWLEPRLSEHLRPGLEFLVGERRRDDGVYVYYGAKPAYRFYARSLALAGDGVVLGRAHRGDPRGYLPELAPLASRPRVWLVFSHECPVCPESERNVLLRALRHGRRQVASVEQPNAAVYLFE